VRGKLPEPAARLRHRAAGDGLLPEGVKPDADLLSHGSADLTGLADTTDPNDIATLIYTSGTTGPPKGVMISQYNVVYTVETLRLCIDFEDFVGKRVVSYLPMAHIAERMISHYQAILGYSVYCCPDPNQLTTYLKEVHPEIVFGVPRVWEKIYAGVNAALAADPSPQGPVRRGRRRRARDQASAERDGTATQEQLDTWAFLDAVAFSNVRQLVGLDAVQVGRHRCRPDPRRRLEWFNAIGVPLSEIYGMSESSGPMTWSPEGNKPGTSAGRSRAARSASPTTARSSAAAATCSRATSTQPDKTAETLDRRLAALR
jgi:long-chain acyl-CoA synthetase